MWFYDLTNDGYSLDEAEGPFLVQAAVARATDTSDRVAFVARVMCAEDVAQRYSRASEVPRPVAGPPVAVAVPDAIPPALAAHGAVPMGHLSTQRPPRPLILIDSPGLSALIEGALFFFRGDVIQYMAHQCKNASAALRSGTLYESLRNLALHPNALDATDPLLSINVASIHQILQSDEDQIVYVAVFSFLKQFEQWVLKARSAEKLKHVPVHALLPTFGWNDVAVRRIALARLQVEDPATYARYMDPNPAPVTHTSYLASAPLSTVYRRLVATRICTQFHFFETFVNTHSRALHSPFADVQPQTMLELAHAFFVQYMEELNNVQQEPQHEVSLASINEHHFFIMLAHVVAACFLPADSHPPGRNTPVSFSRLFPVHPPLL